MALTQPNIKYVDFGIVLNLFEVAPKIVPSVLTNEISANCRLLRCTVRNPSAAAGGMTQSVTIQDGSGNFIDFTTLTAGGYLELTYPRPGLLCTQGISWKASGSGLTGDITAGQPTP